ncbi:uncharacterized protein PHALS_02983 [Plasmopara halstedii]|uniref:Uncharacterized protein n=1 Tax=Plasmopara halstedii TaxID=4781 RepID=A0A0P1A743_PLAHL|nr:uncharacterized protein PHALS_02983 [Plasmopara halstedii]CEG36436.1 hypothetical protein PHALS_02983 [Plasmopara halstedii]|eukprot:XP_024572805.1 hypothetical protein PHALS_02983 [Plasmopara halstedii]
MSFPNGKLFELVSPFPQEFPQRGGSRVPAMQTIPVVLAPGESATDDEALFQLWVQRKRKTSSLYNLQLSHKEVAVRVERHLRFEFAKLKARRRLPSDYRSATYRSTPNAPASSVSATARAQGHCLSSAHGPSSSLVITGKRRASDDAGRPDLSNQKRPRRLGNLAEVASQTFTSFRSRDIPATSPDIGGDDVVQQDVPRDDGRHRSHGEESVAGGDERVGRRPVTRDALRALEVDVLRDQSSAERHAEVAYRYADALENLKHVVRRLPHLEDYRALSE